jgi:hypothetical protein
LLEKLFNWYGRVFMRMTTQVSREQEFVADATAARVAGAAAAISALKRTEVIAPAFSTYMDQEVMPVLRAGYLPPVAEGFEHFMSDPDISKAFHTHAAKSAAGEAGEFDTHPPTAERIAALMRIKQRPRDEAQEKTGQMLKEPDRHVRALLEHSFGKDTVVKLKVVGWNDVGTKVYGQQWQDTSRDFAKWLGTLTADQIPAEKKWFLTKGAELCAKDAADAPAEHKIGFAVFVLRCAVGTALLRDGWTIETAPGRPIHVVKGETRVDLLATLSKLADGSLAADEWKTTCASMGISGVPLATKS